MGAKNCPETPRQKMINMMYIVLTAMLALNVAAEVLEAFRVVDSSLAQTISTVNNKNEQVYAAFKFAYDQNEEKVDEWYNKAILVRQNADSLINYIWDLSEHIVAVSGGIPVDEEHPLRADSPFFINQKGDTIRLKKEDDLNTPSEILINQKKASELKNKITSFKETLLALTSEDDTNFRQTILEELDTSDPPTKLGELTWEVQYFDSKPLIAVITLFKKIQLDVKNAESHMINYLYSQIDAESFKFNKLQAQVIPVSNIVLQGDTYESKVFLAATDTTQQPVILINGKESEVVDGQATYKVQTTTPGTFKWSGIIKYKNPAGIIQNYPFESEYQVTPPSVTVSATKMNVFYRGLPNPVDIAVPGVSKEDIRIEVSNGRFEKNGQLFYIYPTDLDELGRRTKVSVFATVGGQERFMNDTQWRVKQVPDPVAKIAGKSGGNIRKEELKVQEGIEAILEDFLFDLKFRVTEFNMYVQGAGGYVDMYPSKSARFTDDQKRQLERLNTNTIIYFDEIVANGDDGTTRDLDPISFKIR